MSFTNCKVLSANTRCCQDHLVAQNTLDDVHANCESLENGDLD